MWGRRPGRSEPPAASDTSGPGRSDRGSDLPRAAPEAQASRMCGGRQRLPEGGALGPELPAGGGGRWRNRSAPRLLCP